MRLQKPVDIDDQLAKESGFIALGLSQVTDEQDLEPRVAGCQDKHSNAKSHSLTAEDLYRKLQEKEAEIHLFQVAGN